MRAYMIGYKLPTTMIGEQVAKIIASKNDNFPEGKYVTGPFGWRTHTVCNPKNYIGIPGVIPMTVMPDVGSYPISLGLGVLGMPGNTAYFGLKEICKPMPGETIIITGAAGAVGSHVGQIAKSLGCRVVGFAGTDDKCNYLEKELGFDRAFNYKTADIRAALKEGAPKRVDCYFDNVGGEISSTILSYMNKYGRVAVCGSISSYNDTHLPKEAEYLSVDPYMRAYMIGYKLPTTMIGEQVAKIIASKNDNFPEGKYVTGPFGWRTHTVCNPKNYIGIPGVIPMTVMPDVGSYPISLGLGVLGMPGNTAYFGLKEICKPMPGETIIITGAAGAVGSHVGQIAKSLGCRVVGFAGTDDKCNYLEKELGFDRAFNYKTADIRAALKEGAPKRVDCYFDNVGGEISSTILSYMNKYGRVAVCGSISSYNDTHLPKVTILQPAIVFKELKVEGFLVNRWTDRWDEGINANLKWLLEGKLKYQEKVYYGFENMVDALNGLLRGENTGKAVVKVK